MKSVLGHVIFIALLGSVVIYGCGGGSSTSPDVGGFAQKNLEGTWERPDGTQYTIDESGNITNVGGGPDQTNSFSGRLTVLDNEGNVSGTINVNHRHADGQSSHDHPINFTGRFISSTTLQMNWSVPGAGSGATTWNKLS